ncbi:MAG: oligoendopeptidase F [Planctomycetales bacterium]|nr:oligoendopeptidase F [Planctomycetales bacterium]
MSKIKRLPPRSKTKVDDTWDLSSLYADNAAWESDFKKLDKLVGGFGAFRGRLGESAAVLAECLAFDHEFDRLAERLGVYAFLKTTEDQTNNEYQAMMGRFQALSTKASQAASFIRPEIMAIPNAKMKKLLSAPELEAYRLQLERTLRFKPHTLGHKEEELLAMQGEMAQAAGKAFRQLLDADLKFGLVENEKGERVELGNATFLQLLQSPSRNVRKSAFHQYYEQFQNHENTLAATLAGSIHKDCYYAKARNYSSALDAALFPDNVPRSVYENLIASVHGRLPAVHRYYELRRRKMKLRDIHHYDTYIPIISELEKRHTWDQAVKVILAALKPLGDEYCQILEGGLRGRWCDRYPNQGKQSGAFSCGSFDGDPYILMNYKPEVLNDVYTLAHEAGHSMHSYYSSKHQPFPYYSYTIFVAEVASTFNEQLLTHYLLERARDDRERAYLLNREIDDMRGTIVRQTMFAEFEKITHEMAEAGEALTVQAFKDAYRKLLEQYFGPDFKIDNELSLECFRIPHFYRAFYVYKYATGMSAAIALSRRVLQGGESELTAYLNFLQGGCSLDPLDLLRAAGVDMEQPEPVDTALAYFEQRVAELDSLL